MKFHITVPRSRHSHGFALVATVSMMVLLTLDRHGDAEPLHH